MIAITSVVNILSENLELFPYLLPILILNCDKLVLHFAKEGLQTRKNFSSVAFASFRKFSPIAIAYSPNFSMFLALVCVCSWHEPKIPIKPQSFDAPNMLPVPKNRMTPATAVVMGKALLHLSFFSISVPFRKEDTSCFFKERTKFPFSLLLEANLLGSRFRLSL